MSWHLYTFVVILSYRSKMSSLKDFITVKASANVFCCRCSVSVFFFIIGVRYSEVYPLKSCENVSVPENSSAIGRDVSPYWNNTFSTSTRLFIFSSFGVHHVIQTAVSATYIYIYSAWISGSYVSVSTRATRNFFSNSLLIFFRNDIIFYIVNRINRSVARSIRLFSVTRVLRGKS